MPFQSLEQAYTLYNIKPKVFRQIAGVYGVPQFWHEYKKLRDKGTPAVDADKMIHDPRYTLKKWWNIIKNSVDIRSAEQYERASLDDRRRWHIRQYKAYDKRLKNLQARVNVTDEESPLYQEMIKLQEILRFHGRQVNRLRVKPPNKTFYSLELETNRRQTKGQQTPHGNPMPYKELSQEVYETLTEAEKIRYHMSMSRLSEGEEKAFHGRMYGRVKRNRALPTFAASKYGGEKRKLIETTREEYENMSNQEKSNYHNRMYFRNKRKGNKDMTKFHSTMIGRLQRNSKLPVFYSPEDM